MAPILNKSLPEAPWLDPTSWRLPGMRPVRWEDWLITDDVFADQMALRDRLVMQTPSQTLATTDGAYPAAAEMLNTVLAAIRMNPRYAVGDTEVIRPDGVTVPILADRPMQTAGRLVQEDLCLLESDNDGAYRLTAAVLCFPASWTLSEKIGKSLAELHTPIDAYTEDVARRVHRIFEGLRSGVLLTRTNALLYRSPRLYAPRREKDHDADISPDGPYLRSERQTLQRLPNSRAVLFSIHTFVVAVENLTQEQCASLDQVRLGVRPG